MEALDIVSSAAGNMVMAEAVADIKTAVREGQSFAEPMKEHEIFTPLIIQMVEVGEQTGALDEMLQRSADFYMGEVNQTVDNLTSILEPLLVVTMGAIVGTIIISLYLPMFDYIKLIHQPVGEDATTIGSASAPIQGPRQGRGVERSCCCDGGGRCYGGCSPSASWCSRWRPSGATAASCRASGTSSPTSTGSG